MEAPVADSILDSESVTDDQGRYSILYSGFGPIVSVGDTIEITIKDPDGNVVGTTMYSVTDANISPRIGQATHDIELSGLSVELDNVTLPADGESTAEISVSIESEGTPVTDAPPTITADKGTVGEVTNNGDGTYTAEYTPPALVLTEPTTDTITVSSDTTGDTTMETVTLEPVPTLIQDIQSSRANLQRVRARPAPFR